MNLRIHRVRTFSRSERRQEAFTLIEVLISVAVIGIIAVPATLLLATLLRGTRQVDDTAQRSGAAQRITAAWVRDVQSVDPTGVNDGPIGTSMCPAVAGDTTYNEANEQILVQFAWPEAWLITGLAVSRTIFERVAFGFPKNCRTSSWTLSRRQKTRST